MTAKKTWRWANMLVVFALLLGMIVVPASAQPDPAGKSGALAESPIPGEAQSAETAPPPPPAFEVETATDEAIQLIDPELRATARQGGSDLVKVTVLVRPGTDLSRFFERSLVRPGAEFDRVIGLTAASNLLKIATVDGVLAVLNMGEREAPQPVPRELLVANDVPVPERQTRTFDRATAQPQALPRVPAVRNLAPVGVTSPESFFTMDTNGVRATWALGITGDGAPNDPLKIGVIDTGVDFANPDLFGTQARVYTGTYSTVAGFGWPIAFDDRSMSDYALGIQDYRGNWGWYMNAFLQIQDPDLGSLAPFTFSVWHPDLETTVVYTVPSAIQQWNTNGGMYRFGWHPDDALADALGETAGVLVSGENFFGTNWGPYDTIYVDIVASYDFAGGAAWATLGQEIACVNLGWSGPTSCDLSGGMIYYISNGTTPVPASDWLYGLGNPAAGEVVAFMINDVTENGGDHGTLCAGTAIGQGQIVKMPYSGSYGSTYWPPTWYNPGVEGGISQGPARDATLVAMGNYYGGGNSLNYYDFAALGYDGIPAGAPGDDNDQTHMHSNSYGSGSVENDGWDLSSRYLDLINWGYIAQQAITLPANGAYSPLFVGSAGNSGYGYGTVTSPSPETGVMVAASGVFGQYNLGDTARFRNWVNWGQLTGMTDRGPTSMSSLGVHVMSNGMFGSGNLALNELTGGDWAVDYWAGTSRSGPEVMGILALIYDAYYQKFGSYPSWREARALLMNGARAGYNDPFAQGAGLVNALRPVQIIQGTSGVKIISSEGNGYWTPGKYRGNEHPGFARGLFPGQSDVETFTLTNWATQPATVTLQAVQLVKYASRVWSFTSLDSRINGPTGEGPGTRYYDRRLYGPPGSNPGFGTNDPIFLSTVPTDTLLLQQADLMVVRISWPFAQFRNNVSSTGNWWFLYAWAWRDTDASGSWFNDANGNRVRNTGEFPAQSETVRMDYDYGGNSAEIRIREPWALLNGTVQPGDPPLAAMTDILLSFRHFYYGAAYPFSDLTMTIDLYRYQPWNQLTIAPAVVTIPAGGSRTANVTAQTAFRGATLLTEGFESTTIGQDPPPAGWGETVVVAGGNWLYNNVTHHPSGFPPHGGNRLAYFNSWHTQTGQNRLYRTSGMNLSGVTGDVELSFWMYHDTGYNSSNDRIQVQVCTTGVCTSNAEWVNVGAPVLRYDGSTGWKQHKFDLSAFVGLSDVRIGFLGISNYGNDCHIDDIEVYEMNYDPPGEYTGFIRATVQQGAATTYHYFPVQKQVWFPANIDPMLGGVERGTLYDNGVVFGGSGPSPYKRAEAGDWRFFYTDVQAAALDPDLADYLLAHTTWESTQTPPYATDIDTLFYGPEYSQISQDFPALFGPSSLAVIGGSMRAGSAPDWQYYTTSGGPSDWNSVALSDEGLYGVAAQVTRWGGEDTSAGYQINVGTAQATAGINLSGLTCMSCTVPIVFKTNHADLVGQALTAIGYGFTQPVWEERQVAQDEYDYYYYTITAVDAYKLQINTYHPDPSIDIDLEVYYWTGSAWALVGSSGRSDSNEQVLLSFPPAGDYMIAVYGYSVPGTTNYWLSIEEISGAGAMTVSGLPSSIVAGQLYQMNVHFETGPTGPGIWNGVLFLGPEESPTAIAIPVSIDQGDAVKYAWEQTVQPGDLITYTIYLQQDINGSNVWSLWDFIPPELEFVSVQGAEYDPDANAIYWDNETCAVDWIEATQTGIRLVGTADDGYISTTLPFNFNFFGATKPSGAEVRIGTNGYATFGTSATSYSNVAIPNTGVPNDFLAPFWDDLNIAGAEGLHYEVVGAPGNQTLVLQWGTIPAWPTEGGPMRYQAQLEESTGEIWFLYDVVGTHPRNTGNSATIGLENSGGTAGVQYSYNTAGAVEDNWAIGFAPSGSSYNIIYDDVMCWSEWFGTHEIILTLRAPEGYAGYWVENTAWVETGPNVCPVESEPVFVAGAMPTWEKEIWINGEGPFYDDYYWVADGDMVTVVDRVLVESDDPVNYTLTESWDDILDLQAYEADFGTVTPDTNTLTWEVAGGVGDTWYTLTKTFEVLVEWGWSGSVAETLAVDNGPMPETRWLYFDIPVRIDKLGPATALPGDVIPYTIIIESPTPILLDGGLIMTDVLPLGVEFAGNLSADYGTAWYDADDNAVYWDNAVARAQQTVAAPTLAGALVPDVAAQGGRAVAPSAPQRPDDMLWDQPNDGSGWGIVSDFFLNTNLGTYAADDFVVWAVSWDIDEIFIDGFDNDGLAHATNLNWYIWADDGGEPAGVPGDGSEVWSFTTTVGNPAVTITGGAVTLDVVAATGGPLHLPFGNYWLSFFPSQDMSLYQRWNWYRASTTNADWSMLYDQGNFGSGFPWTELATLLGDPAWYDLAFRIEGEETPFPNMATITFDVEVTATPVADVVNVAELCYYDFPLEAEHVLTVMDEPIAGLAAHNDSPTTLGETTNLWATITAGTNVEYEWDFGDGDTGTGQMVAHVYPAVGVYTATVTATNGTNYQVAQTVVTIDYRHLYLPFVVRRYGP